MPFKLANGEQIPLNKAIEVLAMEKIRVQRKNTNFNNKGIGWIIDIKEVKEFLNTCEDIFLEFSNGEKFLLKKIIGFSYENWTPLVFLLEDEEGNLVTNFLYMKGGFDLKDWNWVNSYVYGPNLWPDARKFLLGEVIKNS